MTESGHDGEGPDDGRFANEIGRKAGRKMRAAEEERESLWFGLGMFGLVGWSIAVPTVIGIAFGYWLDTVLEDKISWTLTFLLIGVLVGCLIAWRWIQQEGRDRLRRGKGAR